MGNTTKIELKTPAESAVEGVILSLLANSVQHSSVYYEAVHTAFAFKEKSLFLIVEKIGCSSNN